SDADVLSIVHRIETDLRDPGVRPLPRRGKVCPGANHRQHPPTGGDDLASAFRRARVEHERAWLSNGFIEAGDRVAGLERAGVAARRQYDAHVAVTARPERTGLDAAAGRIPQVRQEVLGEARQHDLRFRVASSR
ncbi:MAG: hypothetical protein H6Q09_846, partial [Acidobacteria bacterium]|nr:hypothetical protein [Acidobacteriota bacterium]